MFCAGSGNALELFHIRIVERGVWESRHASLTHRFSGQKRVGGRSGRGEVFLVVLLGQTQAFLLAHLVSKATETAINTPMAMICRLSSIMVGTFG